MNPIAKALAYSYSQLASLRVKAFQNGWVQKHRIKLPVVSIGNLTFGGTGKTPVTYFLIELLQSKGRKPAVASKTYKAKKQEIKKINPKTDQPSNVGDEAYWLAEKFPDVPVYSGPTKWKVAKVVCQSERVDVLLLDDGFQHLHLQRDLDIVLLDATEKPSNYECFPVGRAREGLEALNRAKIILLTKCNLASEENLRFHEQVLSGKEFFKFNYGADVLNDLNGAETKLKDVKAKKVLLVSAIAKPETFEKLLKQSRPDLFFENLSFSDHHNFTTADLEKIKRKSAQGFDYIFVTEKDGVKLKQLPEAFALPIRQVPLKLQPQFSSETLYAKIDAVLV